MDYYLYKKQPRSEEKNSSVNINIKEFYPKPWKATSFGEKIGIKAYLVRANFWLSSLGKAKMFYVLNEEQKIAHTSFLIPKCRKFAFMKQGDYEIGPCETKKEFRGQGIYPNVLNYIVFSERNFTTTFYIIVAKDNFSSIKGIEKAGFERCGTVRKTKIFKRYFKIQGE